MRPHSFVLAIVWAYLQRINPAKRSFRVTVTKKSAAIGDGRGEYDVKYSVTVVGRDNATIHMSVRLESGAHILPVSKRYECVAMVTIASANRPNVVYIEHPHHYLSVPEEVEFFFNGDRYKLVSRFSSSHSYYQQDAKTDDAAYASSPVGLRVTGYLQSGHRYDWEIKDFTVDG